MPVYSGHEGITKQELQEAVSASEQRVLGAITALSLATQNALQNLDKKTTGGLLGLEHRVGKIDQKLDRIEQDLNGMRKELLDAIRGREGS